ncbi:MAG TPA: hypothetical protein VFL42_11100, partial [Terriglobales bacterium]|nr:hypothetical protein [Terriglobales bacterium]
RELLFKVAELENIVAPPVLAFSFTNQQISISWTGYAGVPYRLEASTNLRDWSVVTTNFAIVGTTYSYTLQTNPSGGQQFFRVGR